MADVTKNRYPAYPEYKDSGVEWLGKIPRDWNLRKFKHHFLSAMGETILTSDLIDNGIIPVYSATEKNHFFGFVNKSNINLQPDDLVIPARGNSIGFVKIVEQIATCSQTTIYAKKIKKISSKYVYYYLVGNKKYLFHFTQTAIPQITVEEIQNNILLEPSHSEQISIVEFLDHETAKIDELIGKQERLIALLKEKRQAVISHAVTKGLDPNAPMKDSGVEWLGEIPEHWDISRLKFYCPLQTQKEEIKSNSNVVALEHIEGFTGNYIETEGVFTGEDVRFQKRDVLFGRLRPYLAKVFLAITEGIAFGDLLVFRPKKTINSYYAFSQLISPNFIKEVDSSTYGTKMPRASTEFISNMPFIIPPLEEQQEIASFIKKSLSKFDSINNRAQKQITLLKERRTALISAAVTGKIDLRDWEKDR